MSVTSGIDAELRGLRLLAPAGFFIGLHIRFTSPIQIYQTYDQRWVDHYTENGYVLRDPATIWGMSNTGAISWSSLQRSDSHGILSKAAEFGLRFGLTVACGSSKSRTIAGFSRSDREFDDTELKSIEDSVLRMHALSASSGSLTQAQIDALRCLADGDRQADAAARLGISESALKARIMSARERLSARTTAEAIRMARDFRLI